ncbi:MAG TPA: T9SS type A sorting domain-containing protein [Candidatus Kapabacteria bacterium]|jgi:hypothetical protein
MKKYFTLTLILVSISLRAQSITLGNISKHSYCEGDTLFLPYEASGTFASDNKFLAQLSDASGSFTSFTIVDSSVKNSDTLVIPLTSVGSHYRVRVESTDPYEISTENDADIQVQTVIVPSPAAFFFRLEFYYLSPYPVPINVVNRNINLYADPSTSLSGTYLWQFGQDANPSQPDSQHTFVKYSTPGLKIGSVSLTNSNGCTATAQFQYNILSCHPVIPQWARVVTDAEGDLLDTSTAIWVKAGGIYTDDGDIPNRTVFVESGGSVIAENAKWSTYYIRDGAFYPGKDDADFETVVLDTDIHLSLGPNATVDTCSCDSLSFDYSQVQTQGLQTTFKPKLDFHQIGNQVLLNDANQPIDIRISNLLGSEVLSQHGSGTLDLDLSALPAGFYFAVVQSAGEETVRKIALAHVR